MLSPADLAKKRRECREKVRSHRLKKKKSLSVPNTSTGSADEGKVYKTLQALRNSVSRVKQVLPNSPRKRRAVISKLAKSVNGISSNSPNPHRNGISNSESQVLSVFKLFSPSLNFTTSTWAERLCVSTARREENEVTEASHYVVPQGSIPVISERAPRNKDTSQ